MIQVAHRVFDILELLATNIDREFRLGEIADSLNLNHATCANILKTMIERGYITKVYPHKTYTLGPMVYQLPRGRNYQRSLVRAARPVMAQLAEQLQESVVLTILEQGRCYIIDEVKSLHLPAVQFDPLYIRGLDSKATTRVLLAHLSRTERESVRQLNPAEQVQAGQPANDADWHQMLDTVRSQAVHVYADGATIGLAAPVWRQGDMVAALGVYLPSERFRQLDRSRLDQQILAAAVSLSEHLA